MLTARTYLVVINAHFIQMYEFRYKNRILQQRRYSEMCKKPRPSALRIVSNNSTGTLFNPACSAFNENTLLVFQLQQREQTARIALTHYRVLSNDYCANCSSSFALPSPQIRVCSINFIQSRFYCMCSIPAR